MTSSVLDTDILSEVLKGKNAAVSSKAAACLEEHGRLVEPVIVGGGRPATSSSGGCGRGRGGGLGLAVEEVVEGALDGFGGGGGWRPIAGSGQGKVRRRSQDSRWILLGTELAFLKLAVAQWARYLRPMSSDAAHGASRQLWKPHPDDEVAIGEALEAADRGELLSPEASEAFVRWMEGLGDESWREELG